MVTGLRLGNFKPFAVTQRLPIRPLTLIFGPNSSGKSIWFMASSWPVML
jgi:predicted ATPase